MSGGLQGISVVGGVVPPVLLGRIQSGEVREAASLSAQSYHLAGTETTRDAASRAWGYLRGAWEAWRAADASRVPGIAGTGAARDKWLLVLLRELGYGQVQVQSRATIVEGHEYPLSHRWNHVVMHLLGPGVDLDRKNPGVPGAARAPQAMVQEYLNRVPEHLWAILSNGLRLRLLRDSTALAGSAYLEFDLETIFDGELYPEFLLFWQLTQFSRLEKREGPEAPPSDCWIESWRGEAVDAGTRALDKLRDGVETALTKLGTGFLKHPSNRWLTDALRDGELTEREFHKALLRTVYRVLFCFVAEDRDALLDPKASPATRDRYQRYFSTARLRRLSRRRAGGPHPDLWQALRIVLEGLGGEGRPEIAVPALGGLFDPDSREPTVTNQPRVDLILSAEIANTDLLTAVRALSWVAGKGTRIQPVDYRHLGAEELGSVYESLLELIPRVDLSQRSFALERISGNERKTTGSYYTPPALVSALLDSALDPVLDHAVKNADSTAHAEQRLLALTICDPACGSGGFLVAAARRIARRVAIVRSGEDEPTPADVQRALHDVVGRCIYGVDLNDLAAELAKVSLWLEALEPGKPLGFLDARIRVGNSLLGTTPALLAGGVPDAAFKEIEGDDKKYAAAIRKRNKEERTGQRALFVDDDLTDPTELRKQRAALLGAPSGSVGQVRDQAEAWKEYERSAELHRRRLHADAWCAAFVWPLKPGTPEPPTDDILRRIAQLPNSSGLTSTMDEVQRIADQYRFFHWHLEFPEIFGDIHAADVGPEGWPGGFSCILGNPPWERLKLEEKSYFAALDEAIATATNASVRKKRIAELEQLDPTLFERYQHDLRRASAETYFIGKSGRYPFGGVGDVNTYAVFADLMRQLVSPIGRIGAILPSGIISGFTYRAFVQILLRHQTLVSFIGFENEEKIFASVHNMTKFGLLTITGRNGSVARSTFMANARTLEHLNDWRRIYTLTPDDVRAINPNSMTIPAFRWARDAAVSAAIYRETPVLINKALDQDPWNLDFLSGMFHMANDSHLFLFERDIAPNIVSRDGMMANLNDGRRVYPLYEGKMIWQFDHRYGTYENQTQKQANKGVLPHVGSASHDEQFYRIQPRYWVTAEDVEKRGWWTAKQWSIALRDVGPSERTLVGPILPTCAANHKTPLLRPEGTTQEVAAFYALFCSLPVDYCARQRGSAMSLYVIEQIPMPAPGLLSSHCPWLPVPPAAWLADRALELSYTNVELEPFARDLGDYGAPFRWNSDRRRLIQAEIDACALVLFGLEPSDAEWVIDSFAVLRKYEERDFGEFITKRLVIERYESILDAKSRGVPFSSDLYPEPGDGPRHPKMNEAQ